MPDANARMRNLAPALLAVSMAACNPAADDAGHVQAEAAKPAPIPAPQETPPPAHPSFLVFGDHGYHLEWPSGNDVKLAPPSREAWYEHHLDATGREAGTQNPETLPAIELSDETGGFVLSTGMYRVTDAMHAACQDDSCRFALMLGDNIYPDGADGIDDAARFEKILDEPLSRLGNGREDFAIYSVLGNHDWKNSRAGAEAQLNYLQSNRPFYMDGFSYRIVPPGLEGQVEIFAIDTQILLAGTTVHKAVASGDAFELDRSSVVAPPEGAIPQTAEERQIAAWLETALRESRAKWKIVIGHHPLWSTAGGKYAQSVALRELILPALCRHADAYLSGHEHTLEIHRFDCSGVAPEAPAEPFYQVVSGAAGKQRMVNESFRRKQDEDDRALETLFAQGSTWGYARATLAGDTLELDLYAIGADGAEKVVHSQAIRNRGEVAISQSAGPVNRPNVILLMSDDQGWGDTGYNGHPVMQTPHLDALAASGTVFTRFYAAAPVCSPTRASVLTGRHPKRMGIDNPNTGELRHEEITLAEIAGDLGYVTAHFGKWHLGTLTHEVKDSNRGAPGNVEEYSPPWEHGYDVVFATEAKVPTFDPMVDPENRPDWFGTAYWTGPGEALPYADPALLGDDSRVLMDRVIPFIENMVTHDRRFFTTVWLHSPHDPVVADPADDFYAVREGLTDDQKAFYTVVTQMDRQIGRLLKTLEEQGILDQTLIAFTSDNGPSHVFAGSAGGLRGYKQDLYEGGIRVPGVLSWRGVIPAGQTIDTPVITHDYLPTLLDVWELGDDAYPADRPLDGRSMMPLIAGEETPVRDLAFGFSRYNATRDSDLPQRMALIRGHDKIVTHDFGDSWQLYELSSDPSESTDLAARYPDKVAAMRADWVTWFEQTRRSRAGADYPQE